MSKDKYTETYAVSRLEKMGCKFSDMKTFSVPKGRLGINALSLVDYLVKYCGKTVKWDK